MRETMLRIVADENIPAIGSAIGRGFPEGVELRLIAGRAIGAEAVRGADALLVRSVTRVDARLLEGSGVRFVGSATAGLDHVDEGWLARAGIAFAWAPGSNAESVAEYVAAALLWVARREGFALPGKSIGIVGLGQCGSRVERIARALGMEVLRCDPPLARAGGQGVFVPLEELAGVDFLTLHVPLTAAGPDPTRAMISGDFMGRMERGAVLINASRGGVLDEAALVTALDAGRMRAAVIDAWVGEPGIDRRLLERAAIATPHIAGYSTDGKYRGTEMIVRAMCRHLDVRMNWSAGEELAAVAGRLPAPQGEPTEAMAELVLSAYPIERDSSALKATLGMGAEAAAKRFDELRKLYPVRREFPAYEVEAESEARLVEAARGLGFTIVRGN